MAKKKETLEEWAASTGARNTTKPGRTTIIVPAPQKPKGQKPKS